MRYSSTIILLLVLMLCYSTPVPAALFYPLCYDTLDDVADRGATTDQILTMMGLTLTADPSIISSANPLALKIDGDVDHYFEVTRFGTKPCLNIVGNSSDCYFTSDSANGALWSMGEDSVHRLRVGWLSQTDEGWIASTHELDMSFNGDESDYLQFSTAANTPTISTVGDCDLKITSSSGDIDCGNDNISTTGNVVGDTLIVTNSDQDYNIGAGGGTYNFGIQAQGEGKGSRINIFSKNGDGTDKVEFNLFGYGTPDQYVNLHALVFKWNKNSNTYHIRGFNAGDQDPKELHIFTAGFVDQLVLGTSGGVSCSGYFTADSLNADTLEVGDPDSLKTTNIDSVGNLKSMRISSEVATIHASADDTDVSGINTLFIAADGANNVVIGGFTGGAEGQVLYVAIIDHTKTVTLEHLEGVSDQDLYMCDDLDETLSNYGGWVLICDGSNWYDCSHAKHI